MTVELREQPFDPWAELAAHQDARLRPAGYGATAAFVGTMRDFNEGAPVKELFLEHYAGMTESELERIVAAAADRHGLTDALVVHRVGRIDPGAPIVLVATWSAHRAQAFDACREIMEALKATAPFWKREETGTGARWVERNTPG